MLKRLSENEMLNVESILSQIGYVKNSPEGYTNYYRGTDYKAYFLKDTNCVLIESDGLEYILEVL